MKATGRKSDSNTKSGVTRKTSRAAARSPGVPNVSPLRGSGVDEYVAGKVSPEQRPLVSSLVTLMAAIVPDAKVSIKWAQPVWESNGPMTFLKANKSHVTFGFWRGGELTDRFNLLEGDGDRMKHVKIRQMADINESAIRDYVAQAVMLNAKKGDPTKKGNA